jgi:hypothetical protein
MKQHVEQKEWNIKSNKKSEIGQTRGAKQQVKQEKQNKLKKKSETVGQAKGT